MSARNDDLEVDVSEAFGRHGHMHRGRRRCIAARVSFVQFNSVAHRHHISSLVSNKR